MMSLPSGLLTLGGLACLSGWAAADTTAAFQFMAGQPIVAGWLAGCLVRQPELGLFMGAALQLIWSRLTPVGAVSYPDVGPGAVTGVAVAGLFPRVAPGSSGGAPGFLPAGGMVLPCLAGLLAALAVGRAGEALTVLLRRGNARLAVAADRAAERGSWAGVERANALGAVRSFARGVILLVAGLAFFAALAALARLATGGAPAPSGFGGPASAAGPALFWWFGIAALLSVLWRGGRRDWLVIVAGAAAGGLLVALR